MLAVSPARAQPLRLRAARSTAAGLRRATTAAAPARARRGRTQAPAAQAEACKGSTDATAPSTTPEAQAAQKVQLTKTAFEQAYAEAKAAAKVYDAARQEALYAALGPWARRGPDPPLELPEAEKLKVAQILHAYFLEELEFLRTAVGDHEAALLKTKELEASLAESEASLVVKMAELAAAAATLEASQRDPTREAFWRSRGYAAAPWTWNEFRNTHLADAQQWPAVLDRMADAPDFDEFARRETADGELGKLSPAARQELQALFEDSCAKRFFTFRDIRSAIG